MGQVHLRAQSGRMAPRIPRVGQPFQLLVALALGMAAGIASGAETTGSTSTDRWAAEVVIHRDSYGTPHIHGATHAATVFGFAYAQAEDYFWQIEDTYILALGRYSEVHASVGMNSDLLNRAFEIVRRSKADYETLDPAMKTLCEAFTAGLNYYLETHPEVHPRLITHFEPWHVVAYGRQMSLELTFRYTRLTDVYTPRMNPNISAAVGSNGWAVAPERTASGHAMLFVNPHLPWFGFGQLYEAHLLSDEGWNFTGATFFGTPLPMMGHNEDVGWTFTTNEPDIADAWEVTFDDPDNPLNYRYGDGYRTATEWRETISIKTASGLREREFTFRKTHHGPIVEKRKDGRQIAARIAKLHESFVLRQLTNMMKAKNFGEFRAALDMGEFAFMNVIYADRHGDIFYLYNGAIPRRDPQFDWSKPVDGSDPRTEWQGFHAVSELPSVKNPPSGFVQNCNSSPFTTSDDGNPLLHQFPSYMVEDARHDTRRAKVSRQLLREMYDLTFDQLQEAAFDTTLYWAQTRLPEYARHLEGLKRTDPALAAQVAPYLEHLLDWDYRVTPESTQATLCTAWYEALYGSNYPGEELLDRYVDNSTAQLKALAAVAGTLKGLHGDWKVAYGDVYRIQRHADVADLVLIPFTDDLPSLPSVGGHGPMGVVFTQYYTPSIRIPFIKTVRRRYGVVGATYMSVIEFGDEVRAATLLQFGASGRPSSPHYLDQAKLLSERQLKPELFRWDEVLADTATAYRPGIRETRTATEPSDQPRR